MIRPNLKEVTGELTVFFLMSVYLIILCLKNGLWSRTPVPTVKGNVISSALAALIIGAILLVRTQLILHNGFSAGLAAILVLSMAAVLGGCFGSLEIALWIYRRRGQLDGPDRESEAK